MLRNRYMSAYYKMILYVWKFAYCWGGKQKKFFLNKY